MTKFVPLLGIRCNVLSEGNGFLGVLADDQSRPALEALWASVYQGKDPFPIEDRAENSQDRECRKSETHDIS